MEHNKINEVIKLITEIENLCAENDLSKEETKATMLNIIKSCSAEQTQTQTTEGGESLPPSPSSTHSSTSFTYPSYPSSKEDKIKLFEHMYERLDDIIANLRSYLPLNNYSSYLTLPTKLLEALVKTAGKQKDNSKFYSHKLHLQTVCISTRNKIIFSTDGSMYFGAYQTDFTTSTSLPFADIPDLLLFVDDISWFLKELNSSPTSDKSSCLLKYTPPSKDEEIPHITLYSMDKTLQKSVLSFNNDDILYLTHRFTETLLNVDYLKENSEAEAIADNQAVVLAIRYMSRMLDIIKKLDCQYFDFSKFIYVSETSSAPESKVYIDEDKKFIIGIAGMRK